MMRQHAVNGTSLPTAAAILTALVATVILVLCLAPGAAHADPVSYKITLHANEGAISESSWTAGGSNADEYSLSFSTGDSDDIALPVPSRSGYTFDGWHDQDGAGGAWGNAVTKVVPSAALGDQVFYAKWLKNYTITFRDKRNKNLLSSREYPEGTVAADIKVPEVSLVLSDNAEYDSVFAGWTDGTKVYSADEIPTVTADASYWAFYEQEAAKKRYSVTFVDEDGATVLKDAVEYDYGTAWQDVAQPADPVKPSTAEHSYTFAGWEGAPEKILADTTVKASYTETDRKYSVTFTDDDGTTVLGSVAAYDYGTPWSQVEKPANPSKAATARAAYTFAGWQGEPTEVVADVTVKALYTETVNTYTVTFVDDDGTTVLKAAAAYDYGTPWSQVEKPANPTKAATASYTYAFAGWTGTPTTVTANTTVTASYTATAIVSDDPKPDDPTPPAPKPDDPQPDDPVSDKEALAALVAAGDLSEGVVASDTEDGADVPDKAKYVPSSVLAIYANAWNRAVAVNADDKASDEQIQGALQDLRLAGEALDAVVKTASVNKDGLNTQIKAALNARESAVVVFSPENALTTEHYVTVAQAAALLAPLASAQQLAAGDAAPTQEQADDAAQVLKQAVDDFMAARDSQFGTAKPAQSESDEQVAAVKAAIDALFSTPAKGTAAAAKAKYDALTEAQKKLVPAAYKAALNAQVEKANAAAAAKTAVKAKNTLKVKVLKKTVTVKSTKKTAVAAKKIVKVTTNKSKGKVTYSLAKLNKKAAKGKITVNKAGKLTVQKGLKKGTYTVTVKATSAATAKYKAATVAFTFKVKVK